MVFQWFLILLPSLSMVFDGSVPLIKRCDGFDGSLWSSRDDGREAQSTDDASERGDQHLAFDSVWEVLQLTQIVGR